MNKNIFTGFGIANLDKQGNILDVWFPEILSFDRTDFTDSEIISNNNVPKHILALIKKNKFHYNTKVPVRAVYNVDENREIKNTIDAYFRLHLLSYLKVKPNEINLTNIFNHLKNVIWTNLGPISIEEYDNFKLENSSAAHILSIDKFPRMVDYIIPKNVRIADVSRVRLGAYLSPGTTIMHEGFVNFNAGTLGPCMVEGRISAGVTIGSNTDIGGGASIMGTLSGGGTEKITIGEKSLLGANSGIGISLGDNCVVEAGLYVTAGSKIQFGNKIHKAKEFSGKNNLIFRRNSINGNIEVINSKKVGDFLNDQLHKN